jgi:hypothetical protein
MSIFSSWSSSLAAVEGRGLLGLIAIGALVSVSVASELGPGQNIMAMSPDYTLAPPFPSEPFGDHWEETGWSVSIDGSRALVGSPARYSPYRGEVFVYEWDAVGGSWEMAALLSPTEFSTSDHFGFSVSLDGDRAVVGAPNTTTKGLRSGAVYVFDRSGGDWSQTAKLVGSDAELFDNFGFSVDLDGDRILIGRETSQRADAAYIFDFDGALWRETQILNRAGFPTSARKKGSTEVESARAEVGASSRATPGEIRERLGADSSLGGGERDGFFDVSGISVSLDKDRALLGFPDQFVNNIPRGASYVFEFDGSDWEETAVLLPSDLTPFDQFGFSVALEGNRAVVGSRLEDELAEDSGAAYVFEFDGVGWIQTAKLKSNDAEAEDWFGASVDLAGNQVLVGASADFYAGTAYLFSLQDSVWTQNFRLAPSDQALPGGSYNLGRSFGRSVSLGSEFLIIGSPEDELNAERAGAAFPFKWTGQSWERLSEVRPVGGPSSDWFGQSVDLSEGRGLIGSPRDEDLGSFSGSAYVVEFDGSVWSTSSKLIASDGGESDEFGTSVSMSNDRALIGAPRADGPNGRVGAAYLFELQNAEWIEVAKFQDSLELGTNSFGSGLSVHGDRLMVGAPYEAMQGLPTGAVYIYRFDGVSWSLEQRLAPASSVQSGSFGSSIDLQENRVAIGFPGDDEMGEQSGSVIVYSYDGASWRLEQKVVAESGEAGDKFGLSVSLSGQRLLVGAYRDKDSAGKRAGAGYIFEFDGSKWNESARLIVPEPSGFLGLGTSVSLSGDRAVLSGPVSESIEPFGGHAHIFDYDGADWAYTARLVDPIQRFLSYFGYSSSFEGDLVLTGAFLADEAGPESGAAYVFVLDRFFSDGFE